MAAITTPQITAQQAQKLAQAMGLRYGLLDTQNPPQPRDATPEELGQFALDWLKYEARQTLQAKRVSDAGQEPPV